MAPKILLLLSRHWKLNPIPVPAFNNCDELHVEIFPDGVIVATGSGFTDVVALVLPVHPLALVTVTVKVPAVDTLIEDVVAPFDHR